MLRGKGPCLWRVRYGNVPLIILQFRCKECLKSVDASSRGVPSTEQIGYRATLYLITTPVPDRTVRLCALTNVGVSGLSKFWMSWSTF